MGVFSWRWSIGDAYEKIYLELLLTKQGFLALSCFLPYFVVSSGVQWWDRVSLNWGVFSFAAVKPAALV